MNEIEAHQWAFILGIQIQNPNAEKDELREIFNTLTHFLGKLSNALKPEEPVETYLLSAKMRQWGQQILEKIMISGVNWFQGCFSNSHSMCIQCSL